MEDTASRAIAIVGVGAVLPDAPDVPAFWANLTGGRYSISDVLPDRWDPARYYDPDPHAPDKTYSKIGGWVRAWEWDPIRWKLPIPPRVSDAMDDGQKWAIAGSRQALSDYGWPQRPLELDRTAVIMGNAMAGEKHYLTALRIAFPEYALALRDAPSFAALPRELREAISGELHARITAAVPDITEDTMPGELSNIIAGRVANVFNLRGPNYVTDAACASALAAISAAIEGLVQGDYDAALSGGIDRNMGASTFVKFCKIGALSATGTRPYADGADGFVMGEGAAVFLLKRLADAERAGDTIYAVLRGIAGASDGKGKGITAPNPVGQRLAVERAWQNAGLSPATVSLMEGHGTSTRVGDVVEVEGLSAVFGRCGLAPQSVPLGSVKSNLGHLKGAAGAAGLLKVALALHHKQLPPSLNFERPNPAIDFAHSPFVVNTELRDWPAPPCGVRRAGVSAFGFGGTNFHAVLEEYLPGRLQGNDRSRSYPPVHGGAPAPLAATRDIGPAATEPRPPGAALKAPLRGALVLGAASAADLCARLERIHADAAAGHAPPPAPPAAAELGAAHRVAIDYGDATELADRAAKALKGLAADNAAMWKALRAQGVFRGQGAPAKVAFLYTGQGSQYVNMLAELRRREPIVAAVFAEADRVMTPLLGKSLSDFIFVDASDPARVARAEDDLRQTAITQPAVLAADTALTQLLAAYGIAPDMVMGHSLGEYGALVAAGALPFADALEAVSARGREMSRVSMDDNGRMAAVFAPLAEIERILAGLDGYVVIANFNSHGQAVVGGSSAAVDQAVAAFEAAGHTALPLPVSHAFHTRIVAPASAPLRSTLERLALQSPALPIVANVSGAFYPMAGDAVPQMLDILARQVAEPVQFVKGLETLYAAGARVFVEVGPKKALQGFVDDVLGDRGDVVSLFTNHPKLGDVVAINQALCGLYAAGLGAGVEMTAAAAPPPSVLSLTPPAREERRAGSSGNAGSAGEVMYPQLDHLFADFLERARAIYDNGGARHDAEAVVVSGAALGLPGTARVFDDANLARLLHGEQLIDVIPSRFRQAILDKHITRLVKRDDGGGSFETIDSPNDVIKLAARAGALDLSAEFGVSAERVEAYDVDTALAVGAGLDALRDAGIPLVMRYKTTHKGTQLPAGWKLPQALCDDTGIIFASAFPGYDAFAAEMAAYYADQARRLEITHLESLRARLANGGNGHALAISEIDRHTAELRAECEAHPYRFDRRFLFRVLSMGHSQFAELIGARGPNTHINSACASTTQAFALAEDWIAAGRCRRVVVVAADDATSDHMLEWVGAGFLASGAAATDDVVEEAALPFDRRRHGTLLGMGAAAFVIEDAAALRERGVQPICEVLGTVTANSAFHGTRLDVEHICKMMEQLVAGAEARWGIERGAIASELVFISHETYTPARGGSAAAEVNALRHVFGAAAERIVVANTKGYTGHPMGVGIEDVVAVKALETGLVPAVANYREVDPDLGRLNLSQGGAYPIRYALRLGAGFGSQISMSLLRWVPTRDGRRRAPLELGYAYRIADPAAWHAWLASVSGQAEARVEVVHRTLRVVDQGAAVRSSLAPPLIEQTSAPASAPGNAGLATDPRTGGSPAAAADAAAPPAAAPAVSRSVEPAAPAGDDVRERVLALVAEKTGYPTDMLDLDLDLEADLGIDTVKQAELFATIREAYGIAREDKLKLRDFPTLSHVLQFVRDRRPGGSPAPAAAPPTATAAAAPAASSVQGPARASLEPAAPASDDVRERVLALVAEKTGYPTDMLDLDLDLEADLGIDTVKQAELFATIREAYGIAREDKLKLRDFPTLSHVLQFVRDRRPGGSPAPAAAPPTATAAAAPAASSVERSARPPLAAAAPAGDDVRERVLALVAEKTGYPTDMLDLDLDLEADLGIDTVKQAELFATIREAYGIAREDKLKLRDFPTLSHVLQFVRDRRPGGSPAPAAAPPTATAAAAPAASSVQGPARASLEPAAPAGDDVRERVLALVAEKTGYPTDMLDLDLDLEADLGIDTVKQAELFATIRTAYGIARDEKLKLRDFPTLNHVLQFVRDRRPASAGGTSRSAVRPTAPAAEAPVQRPVEGPVLSAAEGPVSNAATGAAPPDDDVRERVLALVAEKTGYPTDMLDLDLDLEADLGVDTVKQAELFATIREAYGIARDEKLKLRDFPTLQHVIGFVRDRRPGTPTPARAAVGPAAPAAEAAARLSFAGADAVPRRVPIPVLRPPLTLCKATGVTLGDGHRVVVMLDTGGVGKALVRRLEQLGVEVLTLDGAASADQLRGRLTEWMQAQPVHGVYWLPALDAEGDLRAMDLPGWREALRRRVKLLYTAMRALYEQIKPAGTFLVAATRLGGQHGYDAAGAVAPLGGAVSGFVKTYKRERPEALVKVVDFATTHHSAELADALIDETLRDPGAVEIGYRYDTRWTVALQEQPAADGQDGLRLGADSVFVVTGAAGSITAAITSDLAAASGGTFYLLDLVPEPDPADPDLQRFTSDRDGLKRDLFARMKARGERATPAAVDKQLAGLERQHAALAAIDAVRRAGGVAYYHRVDLRDAAAVAAAIEDVRARSGRVDVLLHAGGLEISRILPDKEPAEFDLVFDVKSDGWFNLLHAIGDMPLAATVAFSSIAARFGNGGQADYASANDLLCKCASNFRITRPATRGIAIDWTAWGGIGMATRGSIPKMMELAGIDMLPPAAGVPVIRRELTAGGRRGEILIGQRLGVLLDEWDAQGGLDAAAVEAVPRGPMVGTVLGMTVNGGLAVETTLDPAAQPFLRDHQIDGTPVLPGVMGLEAFTEIAAIAAPGWYLADIENVEFLAPFKFYRGEPRIVRLNALLRAEGEQIVADCRLSGARQLAGQAAPQLTTHFRACVRLARTPPTDAHTAAPADRTGAAAESLQVYRVYFHGPAYQVLRRVWRTGDHVVGELAAPLPANHMPAEQPMRIAPRLIELCFQTAGIWEMGTTGRLALPQHITAVETFALPVGENGQTFAVVTPRNGDGYDAEVVDAAGHVFLRLTGYRTVALPDLVAPEKLAPMHDAMQG